MMQSAWTRVVKRYPSVWSSMRGIPPARGTPLILYKLSFIVHRRVNVTAGQADELIERNSAWLITCLATSSL